MQAPGAEAKGSFLVPNGNRGIEATFYRTAGFIEVSPAYPPTIRDRPVAEWILGGNCPGLHIGDTYRANPGRSGGANVDEF